MSNINRYTRGQMPMLLPGQTRIYARKSTATDRAKKTIDDQVAESFETCQEWDIPVSTKDVRSEVPGHGGDEWYKPLPELGLWAPAGGRTRPKLTDIMVSIARGEVKAIVAWSLDRMWRDVGICEAIIRFLAEHDCMLIDRNGPVDISTAHGRQAVRNAAVAAQNYRETIAESAPRGVKRSIAKGQNVCNPNMLGFRGGGRYSKIVRPVPEEQEMVRRIFRLFIVGEDEKGPMSAEQIASLLMAEGYSWTPDLETTRPNKRHDGTRHLIYETQVKCVLTDCRYVGRQRQYQQEFECPQYLIDGQTVVDAALFQKVQDKLKGNKRIGNAAKRTRALTGLIRCGLCGQGLHVQPTKVTFADGRIEKILYWCTIHSAVWCWCTHKVPNVREVALDTYLAEVLAPLLKVELAEIAMAAEHDGLQSQEAILQRDLCTVEEKLDGLDEYIGKVTPSRMQAIEDKLQRNAEELKAQLRDVRVRRQDSTKLTESLQNLSGATPEARSDAIRSIIRWVAVLPSDEPRAKIPNRSTMRPPIDAGRIVVLTSWGTYHTVVIERQVTAKNGKRQLVLRPAEPQEMLGTVADFPDPHSFMAGLKRAYDGRKYDYNPTEITPGYVPGKPPPIAEFDLDGDDPVTP